MRRAFVFGTAGLFFFRLLVKRLAFARTLLRVGLIAAAVALAMTLLGRSPRRRLRRADFVAAAYPSCAAAAFSLTIDRASRPPVQSLRKKDCWMRKLRMMIMVAAAFAMLAASHHSK